LLSAGGDPQEQAAEQEAARATSDVVVAACMTWDPIDRKWTTDGCKAAGMSASGGLICQCEGSNDFASRLELLAKRNL